MALTKISIHNLNRPSFIAKYKQKRLSLPLGTAKIVFVVVAIDAEKLYLRINAHKGELPLDCFLNFHLIIWLCRLLAFSKISKNSIFYDDASWDFIRGKLRAVDILGFINKF